MVCIASSEMHLLKESVERLMAAVAGLRSGAPKRTEPWWLQGIQVTNLEARSADSDEPQPLKWHQLNLPIESGYLVIPYTTVGDGGWPALPLLNVVGFDITLEFKIDPAEGRPLKELLDPAAAMEPDAMVTWVNVPGPGSCIPCGPPHSDIPCGPEGPATPATCFEHGASHPYPQHCMSVPGCVWEEPGPAVEYTLAYATAVSPPAAPGPCPPLPDIPVYSLPYYYVPGTHKVKISVRLPEGFIASDAGDLHIPIRFAKT